jgi:hypothetical protein
VGSSGTARAVRPSTRLGCQKDRGVARFGLIDRRNSDQSIDFGVVGPKRASFAACYLGGPSMGRHLIVFEEG